MPSGKHPFDEEIILVLVLVLIKDHLNHQKDAHPKGIRIPGFLSYIRVYKLT